MEHSRELLVTFSACFLLHAPPPWKFLAYALPAELAALVNPPSPPKHDDERALDRTEAHDRYPSRQVVVVGYDADLYDVRGEFVACASHWSAEVRLESTPLGPVVPVDCPVEITLEEVVVLDADFQAHIPSYLDRVEHYQALGSPGRWPERQLRIPPSSFALRGRLATVHPW